MKGFQFGGWAGVENPLPLICLATYFRLKCVDNTVRVSEGGGGGGGVLIAVLVVICLVMEECYA
jgi:hypothetical protein